ncbi:hypothetical protein EJ03DRAFT_348680 [Teratosphaeria nubilosa]|uniref:Uncharacterized protein n=1 Tax=Teratosphaeria nubilosa TaxID=161662 RepID=A0A6G1LH73_9PEZI|nr:hypothetical protein EJ03DRAFT_348680 [Teratosphaeria nubilosa]
MAASGSDLNATVALAIEQGVDIRKKAETLTKLAEESAKQLEERDAYILQLEEDNLRLHTENQSLRDDNEKLSRSRPAPDRLRQPSVFKTLIEDVEAAREGPKSREELDSGKALKWMRKHTSVLGPEGQGEAIEGRSWPAELTLTVRAKPPEVQASRQISEAQPPPALLQQPASSDNQSTRLRDAEAEIRHLRKQLGMYMDPLRQRDSLKRKGSSDSQGPRKSRCRPGT